MWPHVTAPHDYTALTGLEVTFSPSDTSKTVSVFIIDDSAVEEVEMFLVSVHAEEKAIDINSNTASIYIINNDGKQHTRLKCTAPCKNYLDNILLYTPTVVSVGFASSFYTAQEGETLDVAVVKDVVTPFSIIVGIVLLENGTATANSDYIFAFPLEIVIPSNGTTILLPLVISSDGVKEDTEKFSLSLAFSDGQQSVAIGSQNTTTIVIVDENSEVDFLTAAFLATMHCII